MRPILEYGASCWDPYKEGQINALDRVQKIAAKFACYERFGLENRGAAREGSCLQSIHRRTGMESDRVQVTRTMLPEQG